MVRCDQNVATFRGPFDRQGVADECHMSNTPATFFRSIALRRKSVSGLGDKIRYARKAQHFPSYLDRKG